MGRLLGTHAFDKEVSKGLGIEVTTVEMYNFGLLLESVRGVNRVEEIFNFGEFEDIFGSYSHSFLGAYVLASFFDQLGDLVPAKAYIKRFVASDAVASSKVLKDTAGSPLDTLKLEAGRRGLLDKGVWGDRVGYEVAHSNQYIIKTAVAAVQTDTELILDSVAGLEIGIGIEVAVGTPEFFTIIGIDESTKTITLSAGIGAVGGVPIDTDVKTLTFDLTVHFKNDNGLVEKKESWLYLSMEDSVSNFVEKKLNDIYKGSKFFFATDMDSASTVQYSRPAETAAITYLESGSDGTGPTSSDWNDELANFDNFAVRLLGNAESQADSVNLAGEVYCRARGNCIWLPAGDADMTYAEAKVWGATFLRSEQSYGQGDMQWLEVDDPIGTGDDPVVQIPPIGFVAGDWFQTIFDRGFHKNPAGLTKSLNGVRRIVMSDATEKDIMDDQKRTELAELGVNVFQSRKGRGFVKRSARMFSSNKKYRYAASIFMKAIIKESVKVSVEDGEMEALGWEWLKEIKIAVRSYMSALYKSSTNNGTEGAFFIGIKSDGSPTTFDDVVSIKADESNNTLSSLLDGEANLDVGFIPPPPAESIFIGVGINILKKEA